MGLLAILAPDDQCSGGARGLGSGSLFRGRVALRTKKTHDRTAATLKCLVAIACLAVSACHSAKTNGEPSVEFSRIPVSAPGGPDKFDAIEGRVIGAKTGQRVVLYAKSGIWWVQPFAAKPFTEIQSDSKWKSSIHLGTEYAALLVDTTYVPAPGLHELPPPGGSVIAVASVRGKGFTPPIPRKIVRFSGYDWEVRQEPSTRGGKENPYIAGNAWTDEAGLLHLRVTRQGNRWACAEVSLTRTLGAGTYLFTVSDVSHMDPAAAMSFYTWDDVAPDQHHRELDLEISRWGNPASNNAQYVIQPYYEPSNVVRFEVPAGQVTFSFHWEPHEVAFKTERGDATGSGGRALSEHVFTSGVPSPGGESLHMNLYAFGNTHVPMQSGSEVVIEKFKYLP
jgi:hypothetical protein